jgi:hypothetical protein
VTINLSLTKSEHPPSRTEIIRSKLVLFDGESVVCSTTLSTVVGNTPSSFLFIIMSQKAQDAAATTTKAGSSPPPISAITVPSSTTTTTGGGGGGGKKKFGKNLNKLTAATAAPATTNNKQIGKQDNGLLLLSAKRGSNLATTTKAGGGGGGGLLSNNNLKLGTAPTKHKPVLALHTESCPSTHDALLGVVVGASRQQQIDSAAGGGDSGTGGTSGKPDAWRVAEFKQHDLEQQERLERQQKEEANELKKRQEEWDRQHHQQQYLNRHHDTNHHHHDQQYDHLSTDGGGGGGGVPDEPHFRTSNWDEYGGRDVLATPSRDVEEEHIGSGSGGGDKSSDKMDRNNEPTNEFQTDNDKKKDDEDPNTYMAKKARERAAKRREEEEKRMLAQKERAAQRLRELDEKKRRDQVGQKGGGEDSDKGYAGDQQPPVNSRALALDRSPKNETPTDRMERNNRRQRGSNNRTLFDPNASPNTGKPRQQQQSYDRSPTMNGAEGPNTANNGYRPRFDSETDRSSVDAEETHDIIHLSGYDDQDRGDRGAASGGPRMLFDHKSGSMVEAAKTSNRPARARKGRNNQRGGAGWDTGGRGSGGNQGRGGRRAANRASAWQAENKKKDFPEPRTMPRTLGVLYARDEDGNYYCVDGEEPDLGYGAHAVPGGRAKNPEAYAKYEENKKQTNKQGQKTRKDKKLEQREQGKREKNSKKALRARRGKKFFAVDASSDEFDGIQTGFCAETEDEEPVARHEWIKPDDKIELITGVESPTLQATAKEFSPATFKIPSKKGKKDSPSTRNKNKATVITKAAGGKSTNGHGDDDDDDDDAPVRLIFDIVYFCSLSDFLNQLSDKGIFSFKLFSTAGSWFRPNSQYGLCHAITSHKSRGSIGWFWCS